MAGRATAWQRFAGNPVGFDAVFSWILVVLAVVFGIFASYKGYRVDDPYPGYGQLDRELNARRALYEGQKAEYCRLVDRSSTGSSPSRRACSRT